MKNTLKKLIDNLNFDYINSDITEKNFPYIKPRKGKYKILKTDKNLTGQELEDEIKKQGYSPATIYEFLEWAPKNWKDEWVIILGSKWANPNGCVHVPFADVRGARRHFNLDDFRYQFLSTGGVLVRVSSDSLTLGASQSDTLSLRHLETRVAKLEEQIESIKKFLVF